MSLLLVQSQIFTSRSLLATSGTHLVQVGGQVVTEVLHGHLLIIAQQCVLWPMKLLLESP